MDEDEYVPTNRVILAPIILTPAKLCETKVETAMELIEMSFGCAKALQSALFAQDAAGGAGNWAKVVDGLSHIAQDASMFLAKAQLGQLGASEVVAGTVKWLVCHQDSSSPISHFSQKHVEALSWGCRAMSTLADTDLGNKIRLGRAGAVDASIAVLKAYPVHKDSQLVAHALQVLLNLPNRVVPPRWNTYSDPVLQAHGHEDNTARMEEAGLNSIVMQLVQQVLEILSGLCVPHDVDSLQSNEAYLAAAPRLYSLLEMCCRVAQVLGSHDANRVVLFQENARDLLLRALHLSMPILPVPSAADVPPLELESVDLQGEHRMYHDDDDNDGDSDTEGNNPAAALAQRAAKEEAWRAAVASMERKGSLVSSVNAFRYATQKTLLYTIVVLALDQPSRDALSDGYNDATNAVKVLLKVMSAAFHDKAATEYLREKQDSIAAFALFQESNHWTKTDREIFKSVRRNPHMSAHKQKGIPSLLETLKQRSGYDAGSALSDSGNTTTPTPKRIIKGQLPRLPPTSPTRIGVKNLHVTPRISSPMHAGVPGGSMSMSMSQSVASLATGASQPWAQEKLKAPMCLVVAEHACWALNMLTVASCAGNRLEVLECGETTLRDMAVTVAGFPSAEDEEAELVAATELTATKDKGKTTAKISPKVSGVGHVSSVPALSLSTSTSNSPIAGAVKVPMEIVTIAESKLLPGSKLPIGKDFMSADGQTPTPVGIVSKDILRQLSGHEIPFYSRLFKLIDSVSVALQGTLNSTQAPTEGKLETDVAVLRSSAFMTSE